MLPEQKLDGNLSYTPLRHQRHPHQPTHYKHPSPHPTNVSNLPLSTTHPPSHPPTHQHLQGRLLRPSPCHLRLRANPPPHFHKIKPPLSFRSLARRPFIHHSGPCNPKLRFPSSVTALSIFTSGPESAQPGKVSELKKLRLLGREWVFKVSVLGPGRGGTESFEQKCSSCPEIRVLGGKSRGWKCEGEGAGEVVGV